MSLRTFILRSSVRRKTMVNYIPMVVHKNYYNDYNGHRDDNSNGTYIKFIAAALLGVGTVHCFSNMEKDVKPGERNPKLPTYRLDEVMKHNTKQDCWVIYKAGVYNITNFLLSHPGGEQILEAAGLSIEPFWNVYSMHHTQQVYETLEELRIGNLHPDDIVDQSDGSIWASEPSRDPRLRVMTPRPFNAETPGHLLIESLDTPNELFFVRQHMPVPELSAGSHRVRVSVEWPGGPASRHYSLAALRDLPQHTVRATLMCAGNRRSEFNKIRQVKGLGWTTGAISTACWTGPLLRDILLQCGVDPNCTEGKHVILTGADIDAKGENFSTSIPLYLAMDPKQKVLVALQMNGAALPPDHGYPARLIVPGNVAFRSVKWLESITVSDKESSSHWHANDYRSFNSSTTWDTADFSTAPPVYTVPVTAAICDPPEGHVVKLKDLKDGKLQVKGYAYSGGGAKILRVDVSADRGASWSAARACQCDAAPPGEHYSWTLWTAHVPLQEQAGSEVELWVKATDSNHNTQPEKPNDIWNIRGLLCNAYHRVRVKLA